MGSGIRKGGGRGEGKERRGKGEKRERREEEKERRGKGEKRERSTNKGMLLPWQSNMNQLRDLYDPPIELEEVKRKIYVEKRRNTIEKEKYKRKGK